MKVYIVMSFTLSKEGESNYHTTDEVEEVYLNERKASERIAEIIQNWEGFGAYVVEREVIE